MSLLTKCEGHETPDYNGDRQFCIGTCFFQPLCPMDICDGSGKVAGAGPEDDERDCPHTDQGDHDADDPNA